MPNTVKLTTAEFRAWRVNKAQWVSQEGYVLRAVTPEEEKALFPAIERTKQLGKSQAYNLVVSYKHEDPDTGRETESKTQMEAVIRITQTGRERNNFVVETFVNGCRYVKGREIIEKRMLATHGECNLLGPNGKRLRVIRNPNIRRPTFTESQRVAPHPDNCHCRGWADRSTPGRHHAACNWNDKAPPHERALPFQAVVEPSLVDSPEPLESLAFDPNMIRSRPAPLDRSRPARVVPPPPGAPRQPGAHPGPNGADPVYASVPPALPPEQAIIRTRTAPPAPLPQVYPPSACPEDCRGVKVAEKAWRWPAGRKPEKGQHHPLCPHDAAYRQKQRGDKRWVLYDIARRVEVRDATVDEVTQSEIELQRSGTRSVTVAGSIYAVVQSGQSQSQQPRRVVAGASLRRMQAAQSEHATRRAALLAQSSLPSVPTPPGGPSSDSAEVAELRARLAELEGRDRLREPMGAVAPLPPEALLPVMAQHRGIARSADHLRNELGLVGNQQATDDIPTGRVELSEPEPFLDPLPAMRVAKPSRPVDYHPGGVRPRGFVPPLPPGAASAPAPVERVADVELEPAGDDELEAGAIDTEGAEADEDAPTDEEVEQLVAEAAAAQAELERLEALEAAGGAGPDDETDDPEGAEASEDEPVSDQSAA